MTITPDELRALIQQFGEPAIQNKEGGLSRLNDIFWAAFYAKTREKIILEQNERAFYDYDPGTGIFLPKSSDRIRIEINALVLESSRTWEPFRGLQAFRNTMHLNGPITQLRGLVEERNFFNNKEYFVHLANCTLKFDRDGKRLYSVEDFSPDHRCRNRSPIPYHPDAKCPEFEAKLLGHIPDEDRIILQKYGGQCLLGRNLMQRLLILDGVGSSSKSAFALVLNGIVGENNSCQLRTQHLSDRFEIGRMIGRTLLIGPDVRGNFLSVPSSDCIKALVGGDKMDAELKGSNGKFHIYGIFNMVITSNSRLRIYLNEDVSAWSRRLLIARYEKPYDGKRIFEIERYLLTHEGAGILNWCLEGLQMLLKDHAQTGDIVLPDSQKARVGDLLNESDSLRIFVSTQIIRDDSKTKDGESWSLTTEEIVKDYWSDCITKNWTPLSKEEAEKKLPDLMLRYFNVTRSNDIDRAPRRTLRGFWHVKFNYGANNIF